MKSVLRRILAEREKLRLAIVGSRGFARLDIVWSYLDWLLETLEDRGRLVIVTGDAKGVDEKASLWAIGRKVELVVHVADWRQYGERAGYIRNVELWKDADAGVAFWDGSSPGTRHSIKIAREQNKPIWVFADEWRNDLSFVPKRFLRN